MNLEEYFVELLLELDLVDKNDLGYFVKSDRVIIEYSSNQFIELFPKHLTEINKGILPKITGIKYYPHFGFKYKNYAEFFVALSHLDFDTMKWEEIFTVDQRLSFKINNDLFELSLASSLIKLLFTSHYGEDTIQPNSFDRYLTIKISFSGNRDSKSLFNKGIYYLNSDYLVKARLFASILHLNDPISYDDYYKILDKARTIERKKIVNRKDFISDEPLILYNYACSLKSENRFIAYYRVLEYFFYRYRYSKVDEIRFNKSVTNDELLRFASMKSEQELLRGLTDSITSVKDKNKMIDFAKSNKLITNNDFYELSKNLYTFRNSIVHAKESQIQNATIPDPFEIDQSEVLNSWNIIIRELSEHAIKTYNTNLT